VARRTSGGALLARRVAVTLPAYARGIGVEDTAKLSHPQLDEYISSTVRDDFNRVRKRAVKTEHLSRSGWGHDAPLAKQIEELVDLEYRANKRDAEIGARVTAVNELVRSINATWDMVIIDMLTPWGFDVVGPRDQYTRAFGEHVYLMEPEDLIRFVPQRNSYTSYATPPPPLGSAGRTTPATTRADDSNRLGKFAAGFAALQDRLPDIAPRGDLVGLDGTTTLRLALPRLRWTQAKTLLPSHLLRLLFDVRYQLESDDGTVIDERTTKPGQGGLTKEQMRLPDPVRDWQADKQQRENANLPGTLRSWHADKREELPPNAFDRDDVPMHARHLHKHYTRTGPRPEFKVNKYAKQYAKLRRGPIGYAEYTTAEPNTRIVLDYIGKHVYLTLTNSCYWALLTRTDGSHEVWDSRTHQLAHAEERLDRVRARDAVKDAVMMSPWMEIVMP
jgi:hypothetical protein